MEDGVRLLLETSNTLVVRLFRKATGYKGTSQPTPVVSYFEEQLSLNNYYKRNPKILQLLLPQSDKNEWVDAILLCNLDKLYVVGIQITTSSLVTAKINKTNCFVKWMEKQHFTDDITPETQVFFIWKDNKSEFKNIQWWPFSEIDHRLGVLSLKEPCKAPNGMFDLLLLSCACTSHQDYVLAT